MGTESDWADTSGSSARIAANRHIFAAAVARRAAIASSRHAERHALRIAGQAKLPKYESAEVRPRKCKSRLLQRGKSTSDQRAIGGTVGVMSFAVSSDCTRKNIRSEKVTKSRDVSPPAGRPPHRQPRRHRRQPRYRPLRYRPAPPAAPPPRRRPPRRRPPPRRRWLRRRRPGMPIVLTARCTVVWHFWTLVPNAVSGDGNRMVQTSKFGRWCTSIVDFARCKSRLLHFVRVLLHF